MDMPREICSDHPLLLVREMSKSRPWSTIAEARTVRCPLLTAHRCHWDLVRQWKRSAKRGGNPRLLNAQPWRNLCFHDSLVGQVSAIRHYSICVNVFQHP